jgi:hypothetical protein
MLAAQNLRGDVAQGGGLGGAVGEVEMLLCSVNSSSELTGNCKVASSIPCGLAAL